MRNIRLDIEYDGEGLFGWQKQANHPTVQGLIEARLKQLSGKPVTLYGASRTDTGVHARGQVANFYSELEIPEAKWGEVLNVGLPLNVRVVRATEMGPDFHAQKHTVSKLYEYRVHNSKFPSALDRRVYFYPYPLDWEAIRAAMPHFEGEHDFKAFQCTGSGVKTSVRKILSFRLSEGPNGLYTFSVEGTGFLKQMVRSIVGTVIEVGEGKRTPGEIPGILAGRDRGLAGRTAPASGLCLMRINYQTTPQ